MESKRNVNIARIICFCIFLGIGRAAGKPAMKPCKANSTEEELEKCIIDQSPVLLKLISNGVPDLGIPTLDPLLIKNVEVPMISDPVWHIVNVQVEGLSNAELLTARFNYSDQRAFFKTLVKNLKIKAFSTMKGYYVPDIEHVFKPISVEIDNIVMDIDIPYNLTNNTVDILPEFDIDLHLCESQNDQLKLSKEEQIIFDKLLMHGISNTNNSKEDLDVIEKALDIIEKQTQKEMEREMEEEKTRAKSAELEKGKEKRRILEEGKVQEKYWRKAFKQYEPQIEEAVKQALHPIVKNTVSKVDVRDLFIGD